jgi:hypothetical protein
MEWRSINAPLWLWIAAFVGLWAWGGMCGAMLWHYIKIRPLERYEEFANRKTEPGGATEASFAGE